MRRGELFAVLFHAVFDHQQERLLFHRLIFQKFENALHFVGLEVLFRALQELVQLAVECGVFFGAHRFRLPDGGVHGQVFEHERGAGENAHQIALLPEIEDLQKARQGDAEQFCRRLRVEFARALAKVKPVEIGAHRVAVRLRQVLRDELIFHAREHIGGEIF